MMKAVFKTLAISFGGGLALGAGIRLTQGGAKTRKEPGVNLDPVLHRLKSVESRIVQMESSGRAEHTGAFVSSTDTSIVETLTAFETRLAKQFTDAEQLRGEIRQMDHRLADLDSQLPVIIQSTVDVRFGEVQRKLQQGFEEAQDRSMTAFVSTLQNKVVERISMLETNLAEQSQAIGKLRETSLKTDENLQKMLIGIEKLVDQATAVAPNPAPARTAAPLETRAAKNELVTEAVAPPLESQAMEPGPVLAREPVAEPVVAHTFEAPATPPARVEEPVLAHAYQSNWTPIAETVRTRAFEASAPKTELVAEPVMARAYQPQAAPAGETVRTLVFQAPAAEPEPVAEPVMAGGYQTQTAPTGETVRTRAFEASAPKTELVAEPVMARAYQPQAAPAGETVRTLVFQAPAAEPEPVAEPVMAGGYQTQTAPTGETVRTLVFEAPAAEHERVAEPVMAGGYGSSWPAAGESIRSRGFGEPPRPDGAPDRASERTHTLTTSFSVLAHVPEEAPETALALTRAHGGKPESSLPQLVDAVAAAHAVPVDKDAAEPALATPHLIPQAAETDASLKPEESYEWVNRIGLELLAPRPKSSPAWRGPLAVGLVAGLILIAGLIYSGILQRFIGSNAPEQSTSTLASTAPAPEAAPVISAADPNDLQSLQQHVTAKPGDPAPLVELAREYARRKNWSKAEANYRAALEAGPGNREAALGLSDVLYQEQKYEESAAVLNKLSAAKSQ